MIDPVYGHFIWSDYKRNGKYETGVMLQNVLKDMKYVSEGVIDIGWL